MALGHRMETNMGMPQTWGIFLLSIAVWRGLANAQEPKKDIEQIQGTWAMNSIGWGGKELPKDLMAGYKLVFNGDQLAWTGAIGMTSRMGKITPLEGSFPGGFKIDADKKPKEMDISLELKGGRSTLLLGIYEIEGDKLKVCFAGSRSGIRPVDFNQKDKGNTGFMMLTRSKK